MVALVPAGTEVLAGLELGGVPIATALSFETGLPVAFVRKERKSYGTCLIAEGAALKGKRVCIVEDVITTGGAVIDSAHELRAEGALLDTVLSVIFRGDGKDKLAEVGPEARVAAQPRGPSALHVSRAATDGQSPREHALRARLRASGGDLSPWRPARPWARGSRRRRA